MINHQRHQGRCNDDNAAFRLPHNSWYKKAVSFVPISNRKVRVGFCSASGASREERVTLDKNDLPQESIAGFVTCLCEGKWWLACVLEVIQADNLVKLTFLHPHGPSSLFKYPDP